jgi:UDP-glucose 4-epimerase
VVDPIVVTGASGFVGGCTVRRLAEMGARVHAFVRPTSRLWRIDGLPGLALHAVDIRDSDAVGRALQAIRPAAVIHLATHGAYEWQSDSERILETAVLGAFRLLRASVEAGVKVFVNAGSSSEYGYRQEPMREEARLDPSSTYAVGKAAQTHLCSLEGRRGPMSVVTFRLFSVYGPWEEPGRLFPTLLQRARLGLPLEMVSPDTARDFVYIDDIVDALVDVERLVPFSGEVFNLGTGVQSTLRDVVDAVQAVFGGLCEVRWGAMPARKWDTSRWQADVSKANRLLGWRARRSLGEGTALMARWMDDNESLYDRPV